MPHVASILSSFTDIIEGLIILIEFFNKNVMCGSKNVFGIYNGLMNEVIRCLIPSFNALLSVFIRSLKTLNGHFFSSRVQLDKMLLRQR